MSLFLKFTRGVIFLGALSSSLPAQGIPAQPSPVASVADEKEVARNQEELLRLLRISPTLTAVVERDPTLLSNQEYVTRSNPELARFLAAHPEIGRNPDFYLFSRLPVQNGRRAQALERKVWPENGGIQPEADPTVRQLFKEAVPFLLLFVFLGGVVWFIQFLVANRRWQRLFQMQVDTHNKLIDRFSSSQELIQYMESESGKRFLEAAPSAEPRDATPRMPNVIHRVLTQLQIGVVLSLLGAGLLFARHSIFALRSPLLVVGLVILMPGLGFILSAAATWVLADRLGLMPARSREGETNASLVDRR